MNRNVHAPGFRFQGNRTGVDLDGRPVISNVLRLIVAQGLQRMTIEQYWKAVANNDTATLTNLLAASPEWVGERFVGNAWSPVDTLDEGTSAEEHDFTNTALHTAAVNARAEMVKILLQHGADPNAIGFEKDNKGLAPPVVLAAWEGSLETLRALLDGGADPNVPASAETALYTAAEHGSADKVDLLLSYGARHDVFTASIVGDVRLVKRLLAAYPPLRNARSTKRNRTPLEEAEHHNQAEIVKLFANSNGT